MTTITRRTALAGLSALARLPAPGARAVRAVRSRSCTASRPARTSTSPRASSPSISPSDSDSRRGGNAAGRRRHRLRPRRWRAPRQTAARSPSCRAAMRCRAAMYKQLPYNAVDDFSFISMLTENPVHPGDLSGSSGQNGRGCRQGRAGDPGKLTYATAGNGTGMHLASELLVSMGAAENSACSLSRLAAGDHRPDRQARRFPDGHAAAPAAVPARRPGARDRGHQTVAVLRAARRADGR